MKIYISDLILNYFLDKRGIQTISLILVRFDVIDRIKI